MQETEQVLDVVEEFQCPNQTEQYVQAYRRWRRKKNNPYAFAFTKRLKESAFSEKKALLKESPSRAEQAALHRLGYWIGCMLIVYLVLENVLDKVIVLVLHTLHFRIDMVFGGTELYGDELLVFLVAAIVFLCKYLIPSVLLQTRLHLPFCVRFPQKIVRPHQLLLGVSLVMLLSAGLGMFCVSRSTELQKYQLIANSMAGEDHRMVGYVLFTVLLTPFVSEILLHGGMFQVLRQFGDGFAMAAVTLLAALMTHNIPDAIRMGMITLAISHFVLQTGSFWTAVILHIIHEIYMFTLYYIQNFGQVYSLQWWTTLLLPCVFGATAGCYLFFHQSEVTASQEMRMTYLKHNDKFSAFFSSLPMFGLIVTCIILMVISTVLQ